MDDVASDSRQVTVGSGGSSSGPFMVGTSYDGRSVTAEFTAETTSLTFTVAAEGVGNRAVLNGISVCADIPPAGTVMSIQ